MIIKDILLFLYESITPFQAAFATSVLLFYLVYLFLKDNDLPPGPIGLPMIGYWPFLKKATCYIQLTEMVGKYGDIFSFRVFGKLVIHLGSIKAIKDVQSAISGSSSTRFTDFNIVDVLFGGGVIAINGESWKILRKFFMMKFKEYGTNAVKDDVTGTVDDALKETVEDLHNTKGQPLAITDLITEKCLLILRRTLFNDQGMTREELQEVIDQNKIIGSGLSSTTFLLFGNFVKYFVYPFMPSSWRMKRGNKRVEEILLEVVNRHKRDYNETQVADIIDFFIKEREDKKQKGDPTVEYFTDNALVGTLKQVASDGVLTVGLLVGTFLMSVVEHPEEQEKIYEELMEVIGPERMPKVEDKGKLPFTNAFMYEVLRTTDLFPLFPSLQCAQDTTWQGHKIPKGSITVVNLYAAHHNPNTYEDPNTFNPSRFLSNPDKERAELPIMFGIGKRSCIGEGYAMIQAFMFLTTIVKNFRLSFPEGGQGVTNVFWSEERLLICAVPRSQKV